MDNIKFTNIDINKYELEVMYNHIIFYTIIEDVDKLSNLMQFEQFKKYFINSLIIDKIYILDNLECKAYSDHNVIDDILTINFEITFNKPPLKKIKEAMSFSLNKKNSSIEDKMDILLSNFEHNNNRKIIKKHSKNMYMRIMDNVIYFNDEILWKIEHTKYYGIKYIFKDDINTDCDLNNVNSYADCKNIGEKTNKQTELLNAKFITHIIKYISDKYFINFISFDHTEYKRNFGIIQNIDYDILFNIQLDRKAISRNIFLYIGRYNFNIDKTYSILDTTLYNHYLIEEYS